MTSQTSRDRAAITECYHLADVAIARSDTRLSRPLMEAVKRGDIALRDIPSSMPTRKSRNGITAAELMAALNADPAFVARQREREEASLKQVADFRRAEAPLIDALKEIGVHVRSAWDLIDTAYSGAAVPILLDHVRRPYPERVREGIARALGVPQGAEEWKTLVRYFENEPGQAGGVSGVKFALGCAIAAAATNERIEDLIRLLGDSRQGPDRLAFVDALGESGDPRAAKALMEAASDPELAAEVKRVLKVKRRGKRVASPESAKMEVVPERSEVSIGLDADEVEPLLKRVAGLVSGFGSSEISKVTRLLEELDVDEEGALDFEVMHEGRPTPLRIIVFLDDVDSPDLAFVTTPKLASQLDELVSSFWEANEHLK